MYFNTIEGIQATRTTPVDPKMDHVLNNTVLFNLEQNTAVHYSLHSIPTFSIEGIEEFTELIFTQTVDMPNSFFAVASVWTHTMHELRRNHRGMGWVAMKINHDSDLMPIVVKYGFIPTVASDKKTQVAIAFFSSNKDYLESQDQIQVADKANAIAMVGQYGSVSLNLTDGTQPKAEKSKKATKVHNTTIGAEALGVYLDKMNIYEIKMAPNAGAPFYYCYGMLARMLKSLHVHLRGQKIPAVGILTSNRFEAIACLEAGFFPIESEGATTLYVKTR